MNTEILRNHDNKQYVGSGNYSNTPFFPTYTGSLPPTLSHLLQKYPYKNPWYIYNIHINEPFRRQGYCTKLIKNIIKKIKKTLHPMMLLHVRYSGEVPPFTKCYLHNGFKLYRPNGIDDDDPMRFGSKIALFYKI
jgi:ribosomal protein S18 acetylase RimI-like enzyme